MGVHGRFITFPHVSSRFITFPAWQAVFQQGRQGEDWGKQNSIREAWKRDYGTNQNGGQTESKSMFTSGLE